MELTKDMKHTRLRITGDPLDSTGYKVCVYDADTGETLTNISKIVITLAPRSVNYADVTYFNMSKFAEEETITLNDSQIDLTAYVSGEHDYNYSMEIQWSNEDNNFIVTIPELAGCMTHGKTYEEAARQGRLAIESWIEASKAWGDAIPHNGKHDES